MRRLLLAAAGTAALALVFASSGEAAFSDYGIEFFDASSSTSLAGAHPDITTDFALKRKSTGELFAATQGISFELPPGFTGNPNVVARCSAARLITTVGTEASCPQDSQVGVSEIVVSNGGTRTFLEPVYNMEPSGDGVARLGFIAEVFPTFIDIKLRSDSDYGLTATVEGAGSLIPLLAANTTIWGVPAAESHDPFRITPYEAVYCGGEPCTAPGEATRKSGLVPAPFVTNPTRCGIPLEIKMTTTSYALPGQPAVAGAQLPSATGCGGLGFDPTLTLTPTLREAAAPTGLDSELIIPQDETVQGRASSQVRFATVELPEGVTIAAGAAEGLEACSSAQVGLGTLNPAACPRASKIATAQIDSPALSRPIEAAVYQRTPIEGDLFGIWLVADDLGVHLKLPADVEADPTTGQLTTTFEGTAETDGMPQASVSSFALHFFDGPRAPLSTPYRCGTYSAHYAFTPWSGGPTVGGDVPMTFDQGCDTGAFSPELDAGSTRPLAGAFSSFATKLTRRSGEQNISSVEVEPPAGLAAKLAGVPLCLGAAAVTGDCPADSQVGTVTTAVGPGSSPLWIPQADKDPTAVYLSGPYESAPYSLVIKVPAQAGPFDLGDVVRRAAIEVDPVSAKVRVSSESLPQILEGVPISYRTIYVDIDRPDFTLNPTSCKTTQVAARVRSEQGATASPVSRFQVGGCRELGFKPRLSLRLFGKTNRGAHPHLRAVLRPRRGDANIARASISLPRSEFLDQAHIRTVCTRVQFHAGVCPKGSVYGHAKAFSPLLDRPLKGLVYLRSSSNLLPDLVIALKGQIEVNSVARIDSRRGGIRTTFHTVPDVPIAKVVVDMQGGKKGLLVNSRNLCKAHGRAVTELRAHSGRRTTLRPILQENCALQMRKKQKK